MRFIPSDVLRLVGVDAPKTYPTSVDCPLCRGLGKLEIRSESQVTCRSCWYIGDILGLCAAACKEDLRTFVERMMAIGVVTSANHTLLDEYIAESRRQTQVKQLIHDSAQRLHQTPYPSFYAVLEYYGVRFNVRSLRPITPHIIPLRAQEVEDEGLMPAGRPGKALASWWGGYVALAVPTWIGGTVAGFQLFTRQGQNYLPIMPGNPSAVAFAHAASFQSPIVTVVDDPVVALRCFIWATVHGRTSPFLSLYGPEDVSHAFSGRRTVYWSPEGKLRHYLRAMDAGRRAVDHTLFGQEALTHFPMNGNIDRFLRAVHDSPEASAVIAHTLLHQEPGRAAAALAGLNLTGAEKAQILTHLSGPDLEQVERLLNTRSVERVIEWDGRQLSDTPSGWFIGDKLISSAKIYMTHLYPEQNGSGDARVIGSIVVQGPRGERLSFAFRDQLLVMRKNTADWLTRLSVSRCGVLPRIDRAWSKRLIDVAQALHPPEVAFAEVGYGWRDRAVRFAEFTIDQTGIFPSERVVDAPPTVAPTPMTDVDYADLDREGPANVLLFLCANLLRTAAGGRARSAVLVGNDARDRIARALGLQSTLPDQETLERHAFAPLPLIFGGTGAQLRPLFDQAHNLITHLPVLDADLACAFGGFYTLRTTEHDYTPVRLALLELPRLLRASISVDSAEFHREIAQTLASDNRLPAAVRQAATELDGQAIRDRASSAARLIELLVRYSTESVHADTFFHPQIEPDRVVIPHKQVLAFVSRSCIPVPPIRVLTDRLRDARFLVDTPDDSWVISRMAWDFTESIVRTK